MTPTTEEQRAEFEAWARSQQLDVSRDSHGRNYAAWPTESRWETWQAALSRRSPPPAAEGVEKRYTVSQIADHVADNWHMRKYTLAEIEQGLRSVVIGASARTE